MRKKHIAFEYHKDPLAMRPGDVVPLIAPKGVGHVVVIQNVEFQVAATKTTELGPAGDVLIYARAASSWGHDAGGHGPEIQTWVYDAQTHKWATLRDDGTLVPTPNGPYNHYYVGEYRSFKLPGATSF